MNVTAPFPSAVLFACDHNAVRSPMAEGLMKSLYGQRAYVQSAGLRNDLEIDGFAIAVCRELGVGLDRHRSRTIDEMASLGEDLSAFDLVVALTPGTHRRAMELTRLFHLRVEHWPVLDPTGAGEGRAERLSSYRQARDEVRDRLVARFGPPPS